MHKFNPTDSTKSIDRITDSSTADLLHMHEADLQHMHEADLQHMHTRLFRGALSLILALSLFSLPVLPPARALDSDEAAGNPVLLGSEDKDSRLYANGEPVPDNVYYDLIHYRQQDPQWGDEMMYPFNGSIELYGCAVTSLSMNAVHFGIALNPSQMNAELGSYAAPLEWEAWTTERGLQIRRKDNILDPGTRLGSREYVKNETIRELAAGYPVILGIQHNEHHTTHFVVANGYTYADGEYKVHVLDPSFNNDYQFIDDIDPAWEYIRLLVITD